MKRECPVVAITAFTDDSVIEKSLKVGMKRVINKPVSIEMLKEVLRDHYFSP